MCVWLVLLSGLVRSSIVLRCSFTLTLPDMEASDAPLLEMTADGRMALRQAVHISDEHAAVLRQQMRMVLRCGVAKHAASSQLSSTCNFSFN